MNEQFKKLTEEIRNALVETFKSEEMQNFVKATKEAEDTGSFEVVISTAEVDRQGESIKQDGWDLAFYQSNPIVLWAHDYASLPIGITEEIKVKDGKLVARGRFAPESANPFAQQVRKLYDLKIVRATSVGFIVKKAEGNVITQAELLEFSFVPVPANRHALSLRDITAHSIDTAMLALKGIKIETKQDEPKEGDVCTMEDGTEGILKPDADGNLVCVVKVEEKPEITEDYIRLPVKDAANYDPESIRTIEVSADEGISALTACPKGEYSEGKCNVGVEIITYLFDKEKWTPEEAQAWVDEHKEKTKGEISEALDENKDYEAKWENLKKVDDIIFAMFDVYLLPETPVEKFNELLNEAIQLLSAISTAEAKVGTGASKQIETIMRIAKYREEKFDKIIALLKTAAKTGSGWEGRADGRATKQRSSNAGYMDKEEQKMFFEHQMVLREVANIVSEALRRFNERTRSRYQKDNNGN